MVHFRLDWTYIQRHRQREPFIQKGPFIQEDRGTQVRTVKSRTDNETQMKIRKRK